MKFRAPLALCLLLLAGAFALADTVTRPATQPAAVAEAKPATAVYGIISVAQKGYDSPDNPNGWHPAMLDKRGNLALNPAKTYVRQACETAKSVGCRGVFFWDFEGVRHYAPNDESRGIGYVGDRRALKAFAPEMDRIADALVKVVRAYDLEVGFTVCHTPVARDAFGMLYRGAAWSPAGVMKGAMRYDAERFGASMWYVDSNGTLTDLTGIDVREFHRVRDEFPSQLLIAEHRGPGYEGVPNLLTYRRTDEPDREYPPGREAVHVYYPAGEPAERQRQALDEDVAAKSAVLVNVYWDAAPELDVLRAALREAGE